MQDTVFSLDEWLKPGTLVKSKKNISLLGAPIVKPGTNLIFEKVIPIDTGITLLYVKSDFIYESPGMFGEDFGNDYGNIVVTFSFLKDEKTCYWTTSIALEENFDTHVGAVIRNVFTNFKENFIIL